MGLIPQVKCGRCDRTYSGLRSRCPYCGAHRHKKGKRTSDGDNATWKLIIGILLIVVLIAAVIVIVVTSSGDKQPGDDGAGTGTPSSGQDGGTDVQGQGGTPDDGTTPPDDGGDGTTPPEGQGGTPDDGTTPPDDGGDGTTPPDDGGTTPPDDGNAGQVIVSKVTVNSRYRNNIDEFTVVIGETQEVTAVLTPSNATSVPVWTSSDESVISVVAVDATGLKANCTGLKHGNSKITVTVDGMSYEFIVRCSG